MILVGDVLEKLREVRRALNTLRHYSRIKRAIVRQTEETQEELFA